MRTKPPPRQGGIGGRPPPWMIGGPKRRSSTIGPTTSMSGTSIDEEDEFGIILDIILEVLDMTEVKCPECGHSMAPLSVELGVNKELGVTRQHRILPIGEWKCVKCGHTTGNRFRGLR